VTSKLSIVVDAEANDLLPMADTVWCVVAKIVGKPEDDEKSFRVCRTRDELLKIINSGALDKVIFHNGLGYDLWLFARVWDIPFHLSADGKSDTWNRQPVTFIDTFHLSQWLNPDRVGGHSVESLSATINGVTRKVEHEDWSQFSPEMLHRCKVDTVETEKIYHYLMKEYENRGLCA
jgi:hypothetical protein